MNESQRRSQAFLPAQESEFFRLIFRPYAFWLFRRRFDAVYLDGGYRPGSLDRTVWFMNHYTWWDALTPFLLNEKVFHQSVRAVMEERQLRKYPFFRKLGAFSVNRNSPRAAMQSLQYAADSMQRERSALYIFPQGKIEDEHVEPLRFEKGLAWLYQALPKVDFVPVATAMDSRFSDRPRMFIAVGHPVKTSSSDRDEISRLLEAALRQQMERARESAREESGLPHRLV